MEILKKEYTAEELANLIKQEAAELVHESAKRISKFIRKAHNNFTPSYPYGQFNKYPAASYAEFEKHVEHIRAIFDTDMEKYIKDNGKAGFVKVIS